MKLEILNTELSDELSLSKRCDLLNFNRSSYYIKPKEQTYDAKLISDIEAIYEAKPFYGYRKILIDLEKLGHTIGKKKLVKIRQELNLRTIYPGKKTTLINKEHKKYPYLLLGLEINKPNKVWSTDITYIKVKGSYVYFVGIIDWYSRKILSYRLSNTMDTSFCIEALDEAVKRYGKPEIFNSDQGSQFTSDKFTSNLSEYGIKISMDGKGRWADNIYIERFFRTLKYENIFLKKYEDMKELKAGVEKYINFYNSNRYHSSLAYQTPDTVYFTDNNIEVDNICKIDKELVFKLFLCQNIFHYKKGNVDVA